MLTDVLEKTSSPEGSELDFELQAEEGLDLPLVVFPSDFILAECCDYGGGVGDPYMCSTTH